MPNPGKTNPNYAHTPTDASRITYGRSTTRATTADFDRACEGVRAMVAHGLTFAEVARHCRMPRGNGALYRQIMTGTAKWMSVTNAALLIDGYDRFRANPPDRVPPPPRDHTPTDAQRAFSFSPRTKRGNRTPPKPPKPETAPEPVRAEPPPYESRFVARWKARCREGRAA